MRRKVRLMPHLCYDRQGQDQKKKKGVFPEGNAVDMAAEMGIELLDEEQYCPCRSSALLTRRLSWPQTPAGSAAAVPSLETIATVVLFVYHNMPVLHSSRGFRPTRSSCHHGQDYGVPLVPRQSRRVSHR